MAEASKAIYAALAGNVAVAVTKLIAAAATGSSSMFAEGLHSIVDGGNELLLLFGQHRSARPADEEHPFGHGQELYFWTLIVSLIIFTGGGAISIYEGILRVGHPQPPAESIWSYIVLGAAALFEAGSSVVGYREFRKTYPNRGFLKVLRAAKDPTLVTVMLENVTDLAGLLVAFLGIFLSARTGNSVFDGIGTMLIGLMLTVVAILLARESRGLLTGEAVDPEMLRGIRSILQADADVQSVKSPLTMYFGPETILLAVEIRFRDSLRAGAIGVAIDRIEAAVRTQYPKVKRIFIEADAMRSAPG